MTCSRRSCWPGARCTDSGVRTPVVRLDLDSAQCRLADALRAYEAALGADGAPVPYRLRDELRLLDALGRPDAGS